MERKRQETEGGEAVGYVVRLPRCHLPSECIAFLSRNEQLRATAASGLPQLSERQQLLPALLLRV